MADVTASPTTATTTGSGALALSPTNLLADDGNLATFAFLGGSNSLQSQLLEPKGFSHTAPDRSSLQGVTLNMVDRRHLTKFNSMWDLSVRLLINSSAAGDNKASTTFWSTSTETVVYGTSLDTWGLTSAELAQVNGAAFGVQQATTGQGVLTIDQAALTFHYVELEKALRYTRSPHFLMPGSQQPNLR